MKKPKKVVVLSDENLKLLKRLAKMVNAEEEVAKDPNFALALLFNKMKEKPSRTVMSALSLSLDPDVIEYALECATRGNKKAA